MIRYKNKVKKVDTIVKVKKSATKAELFLYIESLEQKYDALEKDHNQSIDKIKSLEMKIFKSTEIKEKATQETQTEHDKTLKCIECNFEGVSLEEVKWHMNKNHMWPKPFESEKSQNTKSDQMNTSLNSTDPRNCGKCGYEAEGLYDFDAHTWEVHDEDSVECQFCDKSFENKVDLMNHKKEVHRENVESCWHYSAGFCPYGDRKCWFNLNKTLLNIIVIFVNKFAGVSLT